MAFDETTARERTESFALREVPSKNAIKVGVGEGRRPYRDGFILADPRPDVP
jgi:hypothetical protein